MKLNIYSNYIVEEELRASYKNEYGDFEEKLQSVTKIINGGKLLEEIGNNLNNCMLSDIVINENELFINTMNITTGENTQIKYIIKEKENEE